MQKTPNYFPIEEHLKEKLTEKRQQRLLNKTVRLFMPSAKNFFLTFAGILLTIQLIAPVRQTTAEKYGMNEPPIEQTRKLLRKVLPQGKVGEEQYIDSTFAAMLSNIHVNIGRDQLRTYLQNYSILEDDIGGSLDNGLSFASDPVTGEVTTAKYFVIHDTSYPTYRGKSFPSNINDASWAFNDFRHWRNSKVTHIFVNRLGESCTVTPFSEGMTATKLERYVMGDDVSKGMYLHIELIQPRKSNPNYWRGNDIDCPSLAFTQGQYERLALLFLAASVRKGEWLIPAFHACVDHGIRNAHDDPQGFELNQWFQAVNKLVAEVQNPDLAKN